MQSAAICSRIYPVLNLQVGSSALHYDLGLPKYRPGLPASFQYHLRQDFPLLFINIMLFTFVPDDHGSTQGAVKYNWIGNEQNDASLIQSSAQWDTTTMQLAPCSPWCCLCCHLTNEPTCTVKNGLYVQKQQLNEAAHNRIWVYPYHTSLLWTDFII